MDQLTYFILFILGLAMIIKGSDWFIDSAIWVATVFKIPYIIIGATIVSICTTLPETFVSVTAAFKGETDVAIGNAIGSIAINTGFILAILLIFARPILEDKKDFIKNGFFLIGLLVFTLIVGLTLGEVTRTIGILFLFLLILYLISNILSAKKMMIPDVKFELENDEDMATDYPIYEGVAFDLKENEIDISRNIVLKYLIFFILGISLVMIGSNLLVDNGIKIAEILGVPSILIAVTFTSLGTSLPEIVTTITSIRKKATNLGVGNIIGANILNIIQVVGISSIVTTIPLSREPSIIYVQIPLVLLMVVLAVLFGAFSRYGFKRWQGAVILMFYFVFLSLNLFRENTPIIGPIFFGL